MRETAKNVLRSNRLAGIAFLGVFLVTACSKNKNDSTRAAALLSEPAPQSEESVGWVVQGVSRTEVLDYLEANGLKGRVVYEPAGLFEVFNTDKEQILSAFPNAKIEKNTYLPNLIPAKGKVNLTAKDLMARAEQPADVNPVADVGFDLRTCQKANNGPTAVLDIVDHAMKIRSEISLELATEGNLHFSGSRSQIKNAALNGTPLQFMWWVIGAPDGSAWNNKKFDTADIGINVDLPGSYTIYLFTRDSAGKCAGSRVEFGVTYNQKYEGFTKRMEREAGYEAVYDHLPVLQSEKAWLNSGGRGVVVAVIDSGVNYNHPALAPNIWKNTREIDGNGRDDDGNGFVDDVIGWDFNMADAMPIDDNEHGTHVAGLIASTISGLAPYAKIMPLKALGAMGGGDSASINGAIRYAADNGARIINASFGAYNAGMGQMMKEALNYAESKGVLFVAAAGNGDDEGNGLDTDKFPNYPSVMPNANIVAVAATDLQGTLSSFSNFGLETVDVAAPGGTIEHGLMAPYYLPKVKPAVRLAGTSMATPVVVGVAALALQINPRLTPVQVKELLILGGNELQALAGKTVSGKLIDASLVVQLARGTL